MPINGLTINQEKKIRKERAEANGTAPSTSPYYLLACVVAKFRRLQKEAGKTTGGMSGQRERAECIREIDFWLDKLDIK